MKIKAIAMIAAFTLATSVVSAQGLPRKVANVEIVNLVGDAAKLPFWGEKNLMIFYIDPDRHKQNEQFTLDIEKNGKAKSPEIFGFGVINAKDSAFPNSIIKNMAKKRTEKNGALVLADEQLTLATKWGLGDCNNQFVLLFVNKAGELVFMRKGVLTEQDIADFYKFLEQYK